MLEAKLEAKAGRSLFTETWQNKPASFSFELYVQREKRPGDCELFEIGSARTRSDADAAHIRKVQGVVYVDTSDEANPDE